MLTPSVAAHQAQNATATNAFAKLSGMNNLRQEELRRPAQKLRRPAQRRGNRANKRQQIGRAQPTQFATSKARLTASRRKNEGKKERSKPAVQRESDQARRKKWGRPVHIILLSSPNPSAAPVQRRSIYIYTQHTHTQSNPLFKNKPLNQRPNHQRSSSQNRSPRHVGHAGCRDPLCLRPRSR